MHILIKNKHLYYDNYKVKCAIGKKGVGVKKKEGDLITPKGEFKIIKIFYRKDRLYRIQTKLKKIEITKDLGWCNDSKSNKYNKLIKYPFKFSSEKLYRTDNIYDIILVLDFNINPTIKNKGSAIFIHVAKRNYERTEGCIAVSKRNLKKIIMNISHKTKVKVL